MAQMPDMLDIELRPACLQMSSPVRIMFRSTWKHSVSKY